MKLVKIDEVEVKRILEMHSKEKKGILIIPKQNWKL